jgi:hypothetical protein
MNQDQIPEEIKEALVEGNDLDIKGQIDKAEKAANEIRKVARQMMPEEALKTAENAKENGVEVFASQVGDEWYIYRALNRFEYQGMLLDQARQMNTLSEQADSEMALNILTKLREQNSVVTAAVLYPKMDAMSIKSVPAGVIDTLYNSVMAACGFGQEPMPIKL